MPKVTSMHSRGMTRTPNLVPVQNLSFSWENHNLNISHFRKLYSAVHAPQWFTSNSVLFSSYNCLFRIYFEVWPHLLNLMGPFINITFLFYKMFVLLSICPSMQKLLPSILKFRNYLVKLLGYSVHKTA